MRVIAGLAKGRPLKTLKGREIRPTADRVKESLFNILAQRVPQARFLDLFAGAGAVGIEALSRGAAECVFVELMTPHFKVIEENLRATGLAAQAELIRRDARAAVSDLGVRGRSFDLIFIDPPYGQELVPEILQAIALQNLLAPDGWAVAEHHKKDLLPTAIAGTEQAGGLAKFRESVFGETVLSFYRTRHNPMAGGTTG